MVKYNIAAFVLLFFIFLFSCGVDFSKKDIFRKEINGKVIEKFKDENNHGAPTIVYENKNGKTKFHVIDWARNNDFWDYLQVNDSIIKPAGSLNLRIKKTNGDYKVYQYRR